MKSTIYLESSVISYLTSRPNRDLVIAGRQAVTFDWWENHRQRFELRISILVEEEIGRGDPSTAQLRLETVADIPSLTISDEATRIADLLLAKTLCQRVAKKMPCTLALLPHKVSISY